jgi:hypothetical protein
MLLTALATFLVLTGVEVALFASAQAWFAHLLGPAGAVLATLLMAALPIANIFLSWYAAKRICVLFWPDVANEKAQNQPTRRRLVGQHQL